MASLTDQLPLYGGADDDALAGDARANVMHGDAGDDTLTGVGGADTLIGGLGDDLLFGGSGANVLYGGAGADILTYDSEEADGALQRLFGGDGANTLVLEFVQDDYLQPGVIDEVEAYANALEAGENPGGGGEFIFSSFALRASNFSNILIFVDGDPLAPGEVPGVDAVDDAFSTIESGTISDSVITNDNFPAGALVSLLAPPARGDLTLQSDGSFTFATNGEFESISAGDTATITFDYRLTDEGDTSDATVEITITGENDAPTAGAAVVDTDENQSVSGNLIAASGATDVDANDILSILSVNGQALGGAAQIVSLPSGAEISVSPLGAYTYAPGAAFDSLATGDTDTDVITFVISDGQGGQVASSLTLTINGENDAPVANADAAITTEEDAVTFDVLGNDTDVDQGDTLTVVSVDSVTGGGTAIVTPTGQIQFRPGADFQTLSAGANAFVEIAYTMQDASGARASSVATVTVTGVNDAPMADAIVDSTTEDTDLTGNLLDDANANDIDNADVLTISAIDGAAFAGGFSAPTNGGALLSVLANGDYTYAPSAGFNGLGVGETATDSFTFTVDDGRGGAVTRTFSIDITGENDGPVVQDVTITAAENGGTTVDLLADSNAFDPDDNGVLSLTQVNGAAPDPTAPIFAGSDGGQLTLGSGGAATFDAQGDFEELSVGDTATTTFTFTIQDDQGAAVTRTLSVEVTGENDDPTADPVDLSTDEDTAATGNFLDDSNAFDIDQNDTLTITEIGADGLTDGALNGVQRTIILPNGATLTIAPNGDYSYLPGPLFQQLASGQTGSTDFSFRVADGQGGEIDVAVDVSIDGVNDDPTADAIMRGALEDDTVFGNLLTDSNAADVDNGDVLRLAEVNGQAVGTSGVNITGTDGGTLFVSELGGYTFNPNGDFEFLSVGDTADTTFTFRIGDSFDGFVEQDITFEVAGANDAPEVNAINVSTDEDTAVTGNILVDGAATDIDQNDVLVVTRIIADGVNDGALNGSLRIFTLSSGAQLTVSPDGSYTYDPLQAFQSLAEDDTNDDRFSFEISDGNGGVTRQLLTVSIDGVNDAPTLDPIAATTTENADIFGDLLSESNAADIDLGDSVTVVSVEGQDATSATATITRPGEGRFRAFESNYDFDPLTDFDRLSVGDTEDVSFEFTVTDTFGAQVTSTITITITGENDGPMAEDFANATTEDDDLNGNLLTDGNAQDVDQNDVLTITSFNAIGPGNVSLNGASVRVNLESGARLTVNPDGDYTLEPNGAFETLSPGETFTETFSFTVSDGNGGETTQTATITINGVNDAPVAVDDTATTDQDNGTELEILNNDSDVDSNFVLRSVDQPDNGGEVLTGNGVFFDPIGDFDFLGDGQETTTTFTYTIEDDEGATDTASVVVTVTGLNDGPITSPLTATTDEDRAAFVFDLLTNQIDIDVGDVLSVENFSESQTSFGAFSVTNNIFTFDARQFDAFDAGDSQIIVYDYDVVDSFGARATNQLTLTVEGRDEGLLAIDDNFSITEDDILTDDVSLNDTIGTGLISLDQDVNRGLLSLNSDGTFTFDTNGEFDDLAEGDLDSETFSYVIDNGIETSTAAVTIDIVGVNDGPIVAEFTLFTDEDTPITVNLIDESGAFDPDGSVIELDSLAGVLLPLNGDDLLITIGSGVMVEANRAGDITYDPQSFFDNLSEGVLDFDDFTFVLIDDSGAGVSAIADIEIEGVNDPVEADDAIITADEDLGASDNLLSQSNVFDIDDDDEILVIDVDGVDPTGTVTITLGSGAELTIDEFGEYFYNTNGVFEGLAEGETDQDSFDYTITDGIATLDLVADITVEGVNDDVVIDVASSDLSASFTNTGSGAGGAAVINATALDGTNGFALFGDTNNLYAGFAVAGNGDFNGDGFADLVVGAPGYNSNLTTGAGTGFVLFGDGQPTAPASRDIPVITPADDGISLVGQDDERLGQSAAFVGDVNGDGFDDFLIGNGQSRANGAYNGVARLAFGRDFTGVTGYDELDAANSTEFIDTSTGFDGTRNLGTSVSSAGDINNDGINDFIIGAPFGGSSALVLDDDFGKAFVVFGRSAADAPFGETFDLASLDGTNGFRIDNGYSETGTLLGQSVDAAGDVNGDGIDDIIVSAPGVEEFLPPDSTATPGESYIIYGSASPFAASFDVTTIDETSGIVIIDLFGNSRIGQSVAGIGDFNGDGFDDYIVGADYSVGRANYFGQAFVLFGTGDAPFRATIDLANLTPAQGFQLVGAEAYDYVGRSLSAAGDFNGDGFDDVIIGAESNFEGLDVGEAYVLFGSDQSFGSTFSLTEFDETDGVKLNGFDNGDLFGSSVSAAGDLNQDGFDDVIVGALGADLNSPGAAFVFFGAASAGGSGGPVGGAGSVFFTDVDLSDIHTVSDDASPGDIDFTFDLVTDSTGGFTGEAVWTSEIDQGAFDVLAEGDVSSISVNVTIEDAFGGSDTVTIDIDYVGVNDAPTAENTLRTIDEDSTLADGDLFTEGAVMDIDTGDVVRISSVIVPDDSGPLTVTLGPTPTQAPTQLGLLFVDETGAYTFDPNGDFDFLNDGDTISFSFDYVAEDLAGATTTASATIEITGINDAPVAVDDTATTDQDTPIGVSVFVNDTDPDDALEIISIDATGTSGLVVIESATAGTIVYNPNGNFDSLDDGEDATDTFTYTVRDSGGQESTAEVEVTVTGINDAPVARDVERETSEDDTIAGNVFTDSTSFDPDSSDVLVVQSINGVDITGANQIVDLGTAQLLISPNGDYTYNPFFGTLQTLAQGQEADDVISFVLSDGDLTDSGEIRVSVTGANDAPTATPLARTTNEDENMFVVDLLANAVEIDQGDTLSIENFTETLTGFGSFLQGGTDLIYDATIFDDLDAGQTQIINFSYDIVDSQGARVSTTLELTIEGRDEALLAVDDTFATDEDTPLSQDVSTNDTDQGAVFSLVTTPNGDITFNDDGTFDYDPSSFYNSLAVGDQETDTFTYQIDNGTDTVTADVTITVDGVNDAPAFFVPQVSNVRLVTEDVTDTASGNNQSLDPALSGDGDTVTFNSNASNLIAGDTNARTDIYFENVSETVARASLQNGTNNETTTDGSSQSDVNNDGSIIVFQSLASDLVPTDADGNPIPNNNVIDIYVRDTVTGETELLIQNGVDGQRLNGNSTNASVSADGRFVVFQSAATNVVDVDTNGLNEDVYLHDRQTGETIAVRETISLETDPSFNPVISADGSTVAFLTSLAHDGDDGNGVVDVYAFDVETATLELVSQSSGAEVGDQAAISFTNGVAVSTPSISANGRYISWVSRATNLVDDDTNNADDIFVRDTFFGTTERVSTTFFGGEADGPSFDAKLSDNGRYVTFQSQATNLDFKVPDTNGDNDVYLKDRLTDETIRVSIPSDFSSQPGGGRPDISIDGDKIAFVSGTVTGNFDARVVTGNVNDVYIASIDTTGYTFSQNTPLPAAVADLRFEWSDPDGDVLEFSNIDVTSDDTDRFFTVSDALDDNGVVIGFNLDPSEFADLGVNDYELLTATYDVTDGTVTTPGVTGVVIVGENDAPTADDQTFTVNQGATITGSFFAIDIDDDQLTYSFFASALQGDLTVNADGAFTYSSAANQTGDDIVTIFVDDPNGGFTSFDATFEVNLAPTFAGADGVLVARTQDSDPTATNAIDVSGFFADPEGTGLTFSAQRTTGQALPGDLVIDAVSGVITGIPDSINDLFRIEVTATDADGVSGTGEFWLATVDEILSGDGDDNNLVEGNFSSFIDGLGGNDSLFGDDQTDIFQYSVGDGFDIIEEDGFQERDHLVLNGFASTDVTFERFVANPFDENGFNLLIKPTSGAFDFTQGVLVRNGLGADAATRRISDFNFDDGVTITAEEVRAMVLAAELTDGDDDIRGFESNDTLAGGLGDDFLTGGDGQDTYIINAGDGDDTIRENGFADNDVIQLNMSFLDATFSNPQGSNALVMDFSDGGSLTVVNTLTAPTHDGIATYVFNDVTLTAADIREILIGQQTTSGDDVIIGFTTAGDNLVGGQGNDTLIGDSGDDTYTYNLGDGDDVIFEQGNALNGNDVLEVFGFEMIGADTGNGFEVSALSEVTFERGLGDTNDVTVVLATRVTDDPIPFTGSILIDNGASSGGTNEIDTFEFEAVAGIGNLITASLTADDVRSDLIRQAETSGDDLIIGFNSADTLEGGTGNDTLVGASGVDTYVFSIGDGDDIISDDGNPQVSDIVVFTDRAIADVRFDRVANDANDVLITAGSDSIRIEGGLLSTSSDGVGEYRFTDGVVTRDELRQFLVDQAIAENVNPVGSPAGDLMNVSPGQDLYSEGRQGSDTYFFVTGDGDDTIFDFGAGANTDVIDLSPFNSADFTAAGPGRIIRNPAFLDEAIFEIGADSLTIVGSGSGFSNFERVIFADQTFDSDGDDTDGLLNFTDFVDANGVNILTPLTGSTASETLTSTAADEIIDGVNGSDTVVFNVSEIGNDSLRTIGNTGGDLSVVIDFSGIFADNVLQEDVIFSLDPQSKVDLVLDIIYRDTSTFDPVAGIGDVDERIKINNAFGANAGELVGLTIIDNEGNSTVFGSTQEISQVILDQQVTAGDDFITGYLRSGDVLRGGAGDDTLNSDQGADIYQFFVGDEKVTAIDNFTTGGTDVVQIFDRTLAEAELIRDPATAGMLIIDFGVDELRIASFFSNSSMETIEFDAGGATPQTFTNAELMQIYLDRLTTSDDDIIVGSVQTQDTLAGGLGNDTLRGGDATDTYIVNAGEGSDVIEDTGSNSGGDQDLIQFNIASTAVSFEQSAEDARDFIIRFDAGGEVKVDNFTEGNSSIEQFAFSDTVLSRVEIVELAFDSLATSADDRIIGSSSDNNLRGGEGDDFLDGGSGTDSFTYTSGDGDDTLNDNGSNANSFELIRLVGVAEADLLIETVQGSRDGNSDNSPSNEQDLLITFANATTGSIYVDNGLTVSSDDVLIELVDSGVTLTKAEIFTRSLAADIAAGRTTLEGPSTGGTVFPRGASFIFSQEGDDTYLFGQGDGQLTILDDTPAGDTNRLEITGYSSTDATFRRLSAGAEDYLITLQNGDQIVVVGQIDSGSPVNGVNEIFFAGDNIVFNDADITTLIDGGSASGSSGGGSGGSGRVVSPVVSAAEGIGEDPAYDDDTLVLTNADDVLRLGAGDDHVRAKGGDDAIWGEAGDDTLIGNGGADTLRGGADDDELRGSAGRDKLIGGGGDDVLRGNGGRDTLKGNSGEDDLRGGAGNDVLKGGGGDDRIEGGKGHDRLMGQGGEDTFVFARGFGADVITDFRDGGDVLDFAAHNGVSALGDLTITQEGANARITDGVGGQITLLRVDANGLQEDDFLF